METYSQETLNLKNLLTQNKFSVQNQIQQLQMDIQELKSIKQFEQIPEPVQPSDLTVQVRSILEELHIPSSNENRFLQQNITHQGQLFAKRLNEIQDLYTDLRKDLFDAVTELDRAGVQRDNMIKEQLQIQIE